MIRQLRPVCVLGLGGYVTGPGGLAARPQWSAAGDPRAERRGRHRQPQPGADRQARLRGIPDTYTASDKRLTTGNPVRAELFSTRMPARR